ncbi:MAG: response regulator transcription factor [Deltaproteobacteria bacterium]|nr:response regulator transcription factor [Deltaproteobacteria bacterium]
MKILLVEDDVKTQKFISKGLKELGHRVVTADNGQDGLFLALEEEFDAMILDRMLPKLEGIHILKTIKNSKKELPVLMLSALGEVAHRVEGLNLGADDYLVKPFSFTELVARLEAIARRGAMAADETMLILGDLQLNLLSRQVKRAGKDIELQSREFQLLEYLMRHKNQVVTRTMLLENVWDYHFDPQTNVIDVHISRLRGKIDKGFNSELIHTVRGAGYIMKLDGT